MNGNGITTLLGMLLAIAAVLALAYFLPRLIAKDGLYKNGLFKQHMGHAQHLEILERVPLTRDQCLAVVRLNKHCFLVSVGGSSMELLYELSSEETEIWLKEKQEAQGAPNATFYDTLKDALGRIKK